MKNKLDKLIDEAYFEELLTLPPEYVNTDKLTMKVLDRLDLDDKDALQHKTDNDSNIVEFQQKKRQVWKTAVIAAALILVSGASIFAGSRLINLSAENIVVPVESSESSSLNPLTNAPSQNGQTSGNTPSVDNSVPFFEGVENAIDSITTDVNQSISADGVTLTLDTVTMDDNFVDAVFTAKYSDPVDLGDIFADETASKSIQTLWFTPGFWMCIGEDPNPGKGNVIPQTDPPQGTFIDDSTLRVTARFQLPDVYDDNVDIYFRTATLTNAEGRDVVGQMNAESDNNIFVYQASVDKSAAKPYIKAAEPKEYTFNTVDGVKKLTLKKLIFSPLGTLISYEFPQDNYSNAALKDAMAINNLYIEDDLGNVANLYSDMGRSTQFEDYQMYELLGLSPDAESITVTPIISNPGGFSENRIYSMDGIEGQRIEVNPFGGYIVKRVSIKENRIEFEVTPYGRVHLGGFGIDFVMDDEDALPPENLKASTENTYDSATGNYTYALTYYTAAESQIRDIKSFYVHYDGGIALDENAAITIPLSYKYPENYQSKAANTSVQKNTIPSEEDSIIETSSEISDQDESDQSVESNVLSDPLPDNSPIPQSFVNTASSAQYPGGTVYIAPATPEMKEKYSKVSELAVDINGIEFIIWTDSSVSDFSLFEVETNFDDLSMSQGNMIANYPEFSTPLLAKLATPETVPLHGISFVSSDGTTHRYTLEMNGRGDGPSTVLAEW